MSPSFVTLLLVTLALLGLPNQTLQPFHGRTDAVIVNVSVRDENGAVAGLGKADFELRDNGVVQTLQDFSVERLPVDITLALDVSGSISSTQADQLSAMMRAISENLEAVDRLRVITFARRVDERRPMSAPPVRLDLPESESLSPIGSSGTSLFDAVALSLLTPPRSDRRALDIVLTDGLDNSSVLSPRTLVDLGRRSDAVVDVVVSVESSRAVPVETAKRTYPWKALVDLSSETGGQFVVLDNRDHLGRSLIEAISAFRASYVLRYSPDGVHDNAWHEIHVSVKRPGRFEVRAKSGYFDN
jgi:VWFA-related protein